MSGNAYALPAGCQSGEGSIATARVPVNYRVSTASFAVAVLPEVVQFPGPTVAGAWTVGTTRVLIGGLPAITTASVGVGVGPPPTSAPTGPLRIVAPDARVTLL